jgi:hypothetical protein
VVVQAWLRREIAGDAALKSLVLDIEEKNAASIRVAEHLGADRRTPTRPRTDRFGHDWTMVVYVLPFVSSGARPLPLWVSNKNPQRPDRAAPEDVR